MNSDSKMKKKQRTFYIVRIYYKGTEKGIFDLNRPKHVKTCRQHSKTSCKNEGKKFNENKKKIKMIMNKKRNKAKTKYPNDIFNYG